VPFLVGDTKSIDQFVKLRVEDYLYEFLQGNQEEDKIASQVFKTIILMHLSTSILNLGNEVGNVFVDKGGLLLLSRMVVEKMTESRMNWKVYERLIGALFVLCFKDRNIDTLKQTTAIQRLVDALTRALEFKQLETVIQLIKVLTYFSNDNLTWSQIICRDVIKACLFALGTKEKIDKKFVLALLNDISSSPITIKIIKEIPWNDGIGRLISQAFVEEPVPVSLIIGNFNKVTICFV
jgi:hypothetical protein